MPLKFSNVIRGPSYIAVVVEKNDPENGGWVRSNQQLISVLKFSLLHYMVRVQQPTDAVVGLGALMNPIPTDN